MRRIRGVWRRLAPVGFRFGMYLRVLAIPVVSDAYIRRRSVLRGARVTRATDLVIEAFPRSANTWVTVQFEAGYPRLRLTSHLHTH